MIISKYHLRCNSFKNFLKIVLKYSWFLWAPLFGGGKQEYWSGLTLYRLSHQGRGFPYSSGGQESACNAGDLGSIPGSGRSPGEGNGNPLQYSCLENLMDGAWRAIVHGVKRVRQDLATKPPLPPPQSIYNVVLISAVQQWFSHTHIYILFHILSHYGYHRILCIIPCVIYCVYIVYSSLCYIGAPCCLLRCNSYSNYLIAPKMPFPVSVSKPKSNLNLFEIRVFFLPDWSFIFHHIKFCLVDCSSLWAYQIAFSWYDFSSVQFSRSVISNSLQPMDYSTPGQSVHH